MASPSSSEGKNDEREPATSKLKKERLGWMEWLRGWFYLAYEMLFQRIMASHLQNPMPLPPLNDLTCIITGSTSGIGRETARSLFFLIYSEVLALLFDSGIMDDSNLGQFYAV